jgi:hypothetical protein
MLLHIGVIAGLYFSSQIRDARIFFLIPLVCSIFGLMYTDHALNIGKLARFIRWQVKPRLVEALGLDELVDYEVYVNNYVPPRRAYGHVLPVNLIDVGASGGFFSVVFASSIRAVYSRLNLIREPIGSLRICGQRIDAGMSTGS